jgi:altronate dehydratase small subunit
MCDKICPGRAEKAMGNSASAILVHDIDDVATALVALQKGQLGRYLYKGEIAETLITEPIPPYHKFAIRSIRKGDFVRKYGEVIGQALCDIGEGGYVHVHNLGSPGI